MRPRLPAALAALAVACLWLTLPAQRPASAQRYVPSEHREFPRIKYADSLESVNDRCPVHKAKLSLTVGPVYVNWRPIGFCRATCPVTFAKDPARYLREQKIDVRCVVNAGRNSNPDPKRCVYVNHEIFFLSTRDALAHFKKSVLKYCGWLTDPVSGARFRPTVASPRLTYKGRSYYFNTMSTRMQFEALPDSFAVRKGR